ncbi:hypothetical protein WMO79_17750 [Micrococcaceae bacterium Sec7.4]
MVRRLISGAAGQALTVGLVSFVLALIGIGGSDIGGDEAVSWWSSQLEWTSLARVLGHQDMNFGPYYAFQHVWTLVSTDVWWMRLPSATGAAVAAAGTAGLARYLFNAKAGWLAGLLLVVSLSWVAFAQEIRPYSWALALATLATWAFVRLCDRPAGRLTAVYLLLMLLLPLAHLFAGMVAGVHLLYALSRREFRLAGLAALGVLPSLAVAVIVSAQVKQVAQLGVPTPLAAVREWVGLNSAWWYVPVALLAAASLLLHRRLSVGTGRSRADVILFASWWILPPLLLWVATALITPVYAARYLLWTLPAIVIPAAGLLSGLMVRATGRVAVAVVVSGLIVAMIPAQVQVRSGSGHFWEPQSLANTIKSMRGPSDALVAPDYGVRFPVMYYLQDVGLPEPLVTVPAEEVGTFDPKVVAVQNEPAQLASFSRVWLLSRPGEIHRLPSGFCAQESWTSRFNVAALTLANRC